MKDVIIPCSQEAVYLQENDELDLTIKLGEDSNEALRRIGHFSAM